MQLASVGRLSGASTDLDVLRTQHRLMYVSIRMVCLLKECLARALSESYDSDAVLEKAVRDYKAYQQTPSSNIPITFFESHLTILERKQQELTKSLSCQLLSDKLGRSLVSVKGHMDEIVQELNVKGDVDAKTLAMWEQEVDLFQEHCWNSFVKRDIRVVCGSTYLKTFRKAQIHALYLSWENILTKNRLLIINECKDPNTICYAFRVQQLLYTTKEVFFEQFLHRKECKSVALTACWQIVQHLDRTKSSPHDLLQALSKQIRETKIRITCFEEKMIEPIGYIPYFVAALIRFLVNNSYAVSADFLIESQDKATQASQQLSFLSAPLTGPYLTLTKTMTAIGLFAIDIAEWRWLGISHSMLYALSKPLMPRAERCMNLAQRMGVNEQVALFSLPLVYGTLELNVFMLVSSYSGALIGVPIWKTCLSYALGKLSSVCAGKVVDKLYQKNTSSSSTQPFVRGVTQWVAFPVAHRYLVPYILEKIAFQTSSPDLLQNEATCLAYQAACRVEACTFLGVSEKATLQEIRKAYRQLSRFYHPDHNPSGFDIFRRLILAKKICVPD